MNDMIDRPPLVITYYNVVYRACGRKASDGDRDVVDRTRLNLLA